MARLFTPKDQALGEQLYNSGKVSSVIKTPDWYEAKVCDDETYDVTLFIDGKSIGTMLCSCSHDEDDNCCHMAAVMTAVKAKDFKKESLEQTESEVTIEDVVMSMSEKDVRKEFLKLLQQPINDTLKSRLINKYSLPDKFNLEQFQKEMKRHFGGFVAYHDGYKYTESFRQYLADAIKPLLEQGECMKTHKALCIALNVLEKADFEENGFAYSPITDDMEDYWNACISLANEQEEDIIHLWCMRQSYIYSPFQENINHLLKVGFNSEKYLLPELEEVRDVLSTVDHDSWWIISHNLNDYKILLKKLHLPLTEYNDWLNAHKDNHVVQDTCINDAWENKNWETLIHLLEEKLTHRTNQKTTCSELIKACNAAGETELEKKYLQYALLNLNYGSMDDVHRLKELSTQEEWVSLIPNIVKEMTGLAPQLYYEEHLYDELMGILPRYTIQTVDLYREKLAKEYPNELIRIYVNHVNSLFENENPSSSLYSKMVHYLTILSEIPGGKEIALNTINELIKTHRTYRAMISRLTELSRTLS